MKSYDGQKITSVPAVSAPEEKVEKKSKATAVGIAIGMATAITLAISIEALLVWVILAYLLKAKFAFAQVFGAVILFEYVLGRMKLKEAK